MVTPTITILQRTLIILHSLISLFILFFSKLDTRIVHEPEQISSPLTSPNTELCTDIPRRGYGMIFHSVNLTN